MLPWSDPCSEPNYSQKNLLKLLLRISLSHNNLVAVLYQ
jgi:hypothetical protein